MITILDYGMGNVGSVQNMLKAVGCESVVASNPEVLTKAKKIILPGVGAYDAAMKKIVTSGFREILEVKALDEKVPILGICLGMQLLTRSSEEGDLPGLGWIPADTKRFPKDMKLKVPHMGWNLVSSSTGSNLTREFSGEVRFYFVHSYAVKVDDGRNSILKTTYGIEFDSAIQKDNIYGVQFHPEKSHRFGKLLLKNFSEL